MATLYDPSNSSIVDLRMMVARDGVEPPVGIEPSEVADSTRDIRGRSDYLDIFPARIQYTDSMKF
jgi:hypothetical protein